MYLSVIIPAYNEEDNLRRGSLEVVLDYLEKQKFSWEVIVVDDGSDDNTLSILKQVSKKEKRLKVISNLHMGKAQGIITGVKKSTGEIILFSDMDQATPLQEFDKLKRHVDDGFDIVIGSRADRKGAPLYRQILAYGMILLRFFILRLPFRDTQCGFKAFKKASAKKIFEVLQKIHPPKVVVGGVVNPGFDVEILYLGRKMGLKIAEVPVRWQYENSRRVRFIKDAVAGVNELFLVRWRSLTNAYKLR